MNSTGIWVSLSLLLQDLDFQGFQGWDWMPLVFERKWNGTVKNPQENWQRFCHISLYFLNLFSAIYVQFLMPLFACLHPIPKFPVPIQPCTIQQDPILQNIQFIHILMEPLFISVLGNCHMVLVLSTSLAFLYWNGSAYPPPKCLILPLSPHTFLFWNGLFCSWESVTYPFAL